MLVLQQLEDPSLQERCYLEQFTQVVFGCHADGAAGPRLLGSCALTATLRNAVATDGTIPGKVAGSITTRFEPATSDEGGIRITACPHG